MNTRQKVASLCVLASLCSLSVAVAAEPQPLAGDKNTLFLAHFDGNTPAGGLAADFGAGALSPIGHAQCDIAKTGRFGGALRLSPTGYVEYDLKDVNLQSYAVELWFRMDVDALAWRQPDADSRKSRIIHITQPGRPYDSLMIEFYWFTLKITHRAQGKTEYVRLLDFGTGRWLTGSEHSITVALDGAGGDGKSVLSVYVDGVKLGEKAGLSPMRGKNFRIILGQKPTERTRRKQLVALAGLLDEVRVSNIVRAPLDLSRPLWRGFLPGPYRRCRTNLPLELYFSKPLDRAAGPPAELIDETSGKAVACKGEYLGNGSVYALVPASPLTFGHTFRLQFAAGQGRPRDASGNLLQTANIPPQRFHTRKQGEAPRLLPLKFRNDNTHVTVEGMERMCEYMDTIEFSMARIKDAWVTNHLDRKWRVIPIKGGDEEGFNKMPKPAPETTYAELAKIDFFDVKDGKVDPIPRCKDIYEVIRKWDKPVHLQLKFTKKMPADEQKTLLDAWFKEVAFDWSRFHSWHKAKTGVLPKERNSTYALAYPDRGPRNARFHYAWQRGWPGYNNPEWVKQAELSGRTTWSHQLLEEPGIQRRARMGFDYMQNNELAYKGRHLARHALHKLHKYEGALPPTVRSATVNGGNSLAGATVSTKPVVKITFNMQVEARTFNYNSVRLTRRGDSAAQRIPMRMDADKEWTTFTVSPQKPLAPGGYVLCVGDGKAPVSVAGLVQAKAFTATFSVGK